MRRKLNVVPPPPSSFPEPHRHWVEELLGGPIPSEPLATCDACVMLGTSEALPSSSHFNSETKCCTYAPSLPSFCIGAALADQDPQLAEGRRRLREQVLGRRGVSPLGLEPTRAALELYTDERFGKSALLRCPFYLVELGGQCGLWRHRNAVCSTWFCKHGRGALGYRFWRALERALTAAERAVARYCVLELDLGEPALTALFNPLDARPAHEGRNLGEDSVEERAYSARWGRWLGRELQFFAAAAELVQPLRWADVLRLGGTEIAVRSQVAVRAYAALRSEQVPKHLRAGPFEVVSVGPASSRVMAYSAYDPLDVPTELLPLLAEFNGSPIERVHRAIQEGWGIRLDDTLLRKLVDFGMLVDAEG